MSTSKIVVNAIRTPDGTVLRSYHRHDYVTHKDTISGEVYMTDGGLDYMRRSVNTVPYEDLSLYSDAPHEQLRVAVTWGTRGKYGSEPLRHLPISQMDNDHIFAVLDTQQNMYPQVRAIMINELKQRGLEYEE